MIYLSLICILGLALGFMSFYAEKLFMGLVFTVLLGLGAGNRVLPLFGGLMASVASPTGQSQGFVQDTVNLYMAIYNFMPEWAQLSVWLFPAAIAVGRMLTWVHYTVFPETAWPRTQDERREVTMQKFSLKRR